jgi:hypothetical protein
MNIILLIYYVFVMYINLIIVLTLSRIKRIDV